MFGYSPNSNHAVCKIVQVTISFQNVNLKLCFFFYLICVAYDNKGNKQAAIVDNLDMNYCKDIDKIILR